MFQPNGYALQLWISILFHIKLFNTSYGMCVRLMRYLMLEYVSVRY